MSLNTLDGQPPIIPLTGPEVAVGGTPPPAEVCHGSGGGRDRVDNTTVGDTVFKLNKVTVGPGSPADSDSAVELSDSDLPLAGTLVDDSDHSDTPMTGTEECVIKGVSRADDATAKSRDDYNIAGLGPNNWS